MATVISSIFYISVLFNWVPTNIVSCRDWRHLLSHVTITRVLPKYFLARDNDDWKLLLCSYNK